MQACFSAPWCIVVTEKYHTVHTADVTFPAWFENLHQSVPRCVVSGQRVETIGVPGGVTLRLRAGRRHGRDAARSLPAVGGAGGHRGRRGGAGVEAAGRRGRGRGVGSKGPVLLLILVIGTQLIVIVPSSYKEPAPDQVV